MESKWDLKKYFYESYSSEEFKKDEKLIEIETEKFIKKYKDKIKNIEKSEDLILFLEDESNLYKLSYKVGVYLNYLSYLDTQNQDTLKKLGEFEVKEIQRSTKLIFVEDEFKQLGYDKLIEFSKRNELKEYSNFFLQKAKSIKYQLDSKTEEALTIKSSSSSSAMVKLYDELLGSFEFEWQEKKVTEDELIVNLMSPDRKIREKAYHTLREVFNQKQNRIAISNSYSTIVSDWTSEIKLRKFDDVIAQRYLSEELSLKSVKLLLSSVKEMYPLYHEFLKIKQKLLNLDSLKPWDLYAPLDKVFKEISFEDGFNQVLNVLKEFDSEFYSFSKEMVKEGRVDVFPNTNKRGSAFASYTSGFESFVFLNYTNKFKDVLTLAHELGHATHGFLSQKQKSHVFESPLCLAETASIFNETLVSNKLKENLSGKEKINFLVEELDEIFATIFRQVQYVSFEERVHQKYLDGEVLTSKDFSKIWREESEKLTGGVIDFPICEDLSWMRIHHLFHYPFYCFTYAFGNILSFSLYEKYSDGNLTVDEYKDILRAGGSKEPKDLLLKYGIDIESKEFYLNGLRRVEDLVNELKELI